jgi:2-dehydropantoate 2-reductase
VRRLYARAEIEHERIFLVNILVMGTGAMGSVFGGFLADAGHRVVLVARKAHADAIAEKGLLIDGIWGTRRVLSLSVCTSLADISDTEPCDVVLLSVKSYDTERAMSELQQAFPIPPPVVSLQNGIGNIEKIEQRIGKQKTIGGRMIFGVEFVRPGHVTVTVSADNTKIGGLPGGIDPAFVEQLALTITAAGIPADAVDDIDRYIWGKVLYNCALNALATIMNVHYGRLLDSDGTQEIMTHIIEEIFAVAAAKGVVLGWEKPEQYRQVLFGELIRRTYDHHPSMLQDMRRGKKTEIDALNGAVVAMGAELGIDVPYNWTITQLIKAKELL